MKDQSASNSSNLLIGLGIGLLAGGIAGYLIQSDDGKKMQKKAKKQIAKLNKQAQETLQTQSAAIDSKISELTDKAKSVTNQLVDQFQSGINKMSEASEEVVEEAQTEWQKGIDKAKRIAIENEMLAQKVNQNGTVS